MKQKRPILTIIVACLALCLASVGCSSGTPQQDMAEKAMKCLKNGDAEAYANLMVDYNIQRARLVTKTIDKKHNGIKSYKFKRISTVTEKYWTVTFNITDGNGKEFEGDVILKKDDNGNIKVNDVDNWFR